MGLKNDFLKSTLLLLSSSVPFISANYVASSIQYFSAVSYLTNVIISVVRIEGKRVFRPISPRQLLYMGQV